MNQQVTVTDDSIGMEVTRFIGMLPLLLQLKKHQRRPLISGAVMN